MKDIDFLQQYIDAAKDSSNRTRQILLVMIIASILVFAAFWNSRGSGWVNSRLRLAKAAVDILKFDEAKKKVSASPFQTEDFISAANLCKKLKGAEDPQSEYIRSQFSSANRKLLDQYKPPQQPSEALIQALVYEFNRLRKSPWLYHEERFAKVKQQLGEETKTLSEKVLTGELQGEDLTRLNRLLLETAYAQEIASSKEELKFLPEEKELYVQRAKEYAQSRSLEQARDNLHWMQKIRTEQVSQIQVPFLGISFDVNDLGMMGGFAFIVLLIWVNYSLWHHSTNLKLAFDLAEELGAKELDDNGRNRLLYYTYQNLAMRQVLTIPPKPASIKSAAGKPTASETSVTEKVVSGIQKVSKLLYLLPFIVQAIIISHDWQTLHVGMQVNPSNARYVFNAEITFLFIIIILTVICFYMWTKTYDTWRTMAEKI
jgi:hypothetical protein